MRLIRVTTNYISYLRQLYSHNPSLENQPYSSQYSYLMSDCFGWADFWTHALNKLGYEVWEPVANAEAMQKTWAKERNVDYNPESWLLDIIRHQVITYQPDILFSDDYSTFDQHFINHLKEVCPSIKLTLGWCGAPYDDPQAFSAFDLIFSNIPNIVTEFNSLGHNAIYFRHAFEPQVLNRIIMNARNNTLKPMISFVGSIVPGRLAHNQRIDLLKQLVKSTDIQIYADTKKMAVRDLILGNLKLIFYDFLKLLSKSQGWEKLLSHIPKFQKLMKMKIRPIPDQIIDSTILNRTQRPVFGVKMFQTLFDSYLTLNNHIDISRNSASNMRLFEATGVGTCLLTDWKPNLHELFEPDYEVVTYRSAEECIEKVKWLLDNPIERDKIAKAGQARTLREHTFDHRALALDEIIRNHLKNK